MGAAIVAGGDGAKPLLAGRVPLKEIEVTDEGDPTVAHPERMSDTPHINVIVSQPTDPPAVLQSSAAGTIVVHLPPIGQQSSSPSLQH